MDNVLFDHGRTARIGLPEAVFCQGKPEATVLELLRRFARGSGHPVLFTRLAPEIFERAPAEVRAGIDYDPLSRTAFGDALPLRPKGRVAILSAGTADGAVSREAARTLAYLGVAHKLFEDCGVAGLWRLTERLDEINSYDVIIVVAGMDAALASVIGGLSSRPVMAVPTSVGYGAAREGESALSSMLTSCAPGIAVHNIDNGYGAACAAARVVNLL